MPSIKDNELIKKLLGLGLPAEDFAVFGSGPMFVRGLKELGHDVDVIARGKAWEKAITLGEVKKAQYGDSDVVELFGGEIEIFNKWGPGEWNENELIDTAEDFEGIKFVTLENVLGWKEILGREKDKEHIKIIEKYLSGR